MKQTLWVLCTTFISDFHVGWKNQNKHSTLNWSFDALSKWHELDISLSKYSIKHGKLWSLQKVRGEQSTLDRQISNWRIRIIRIKSICNLLIYLWKPHIFRRVRSASEIVWNSVSVSISKCWCHTSLIDYWSVKHRYVCPRLIAKLTIYIKWRILSHTSKEGSGKNKKKYLSYWSWSTPWGHVLSLKTFCT